MLVLTQDSPLFIRNECLESIWIIDQIIEVTCAIYADLHRDLVNFLTDRW